MRDAQMPLTAASPAPAVSRASISVVTPTLHRPEEVRALIDTLERQEHPPAELVLVDAATPGADATAALVAELGPSVRFPITHVRRAGGTAVQRNVGIELARGDFVAFIDDDMRLQPDFFRRILDVFDGDSEHKVGGVAGYISNQYIDPTRSPRWRWYRRLRLFTTFEPGRFDFGSGYPINRYLQAPHDGVREIDFMGANCAVWRREVFDGGLRFAPFFTDYGVVEDAHLALSARRRGWRILEAGRARCVHLRSPRSRASGRRVARKTAVNYRFLFVDIVPSRSAAQELRFWRVQGADLIRHVAHAARSGKREEWSGALGKLEGIIAATRVRTGDITPP